MGELSPAGTDYSVEIDGEARPMCCPGCRAVAAAIVAADLTDYYRYRTETARTPQDVIPAALREFELYDRSELQRSFVRVEGASVREAQLILEGIVCAACVWLNEHHVSTLPGVLEFRINYSTHRAQLRWDDSRIHLSDILKAISAIGYVAHPFDPMRQDAVHRRERKQALWRIGVAGLGAMQAMMFAVALYAGEYQGMDADIRLLLRWVSLLVATPVVLYSARAFFTSAWRDLRRRQLGMDVPVSLAIGAAFLASVWAVVADRGEVYFDSVTMFTFFLLTGRYLEMMARQRAGQAAEELVKLLPAIATRLTSHGEEVVPVAELNTGDVVLVRPGETIPADGVIIAGESAVDESLLSGESMPSTRGPNSRVVGGSVNVESPVEVRIEQVGADTVLAAIVRLLERAQSEKPSLARLADRVAAWFVGGLLLVAGIVAWWWLQHDASAAFTVTLSVLVVTCPCALSLATPAAVTAATGALTRLGVLTTRGHALETLARVTHIVFDKTGTLSYGRLHLERVEPMSERSPAELLAIAGALERASEHPVGKLLVEAAGNTPLRAHDVRAKAGQGIEGHVGDQRYRIGNLAYVAELCPDLAITQFAGNAETQVWLVSETGPLARFVVSDELRAEAGATLNVLRQRGIVPVLLSGDARSVVSNVAARLGIDEWAGELKPQDKLDYVRALQSRGAVVAMVGDGVNDAPVLAGAQVSIAMGQGTQLAQASADMILLSEQLGHLPVALDAAQRTLRIIRQNLAWALLYNVFAVPLAATGMVAPWMAAIGMSASSLLVVLNALRLAHIGQDQSGSTAGAARSARRATVPTA
ncbi:MAG: cation transporter [Gammaproteobacteria bacterium SG8_47]|nr:MAG: cation transporter [Gammaproteobacteria bacterium SG8_47]